MTGRNKKAVGYISGAMTVMALMVSPVQAKEDKAAVSVASGWDKVIAADVRSYANIRADGTVNADIMGYLYPGCAARIIKEGETWTKIVSGGVKGYIRNDLFVQGDEAQTLYRGSFAEDTDDELDHLARVAADAQKKKTADGAAAADGAEGTSADAETIAEGTSADAETTAEGTSADAETIAEGTSADTVDEQAAAAGDLAQEDASAVDGTDAIEGETTEQAAEPANAVSGDEMSLLAAIIQCEAGGESYDGKLAVGAVIMNRVNSGSFPNSITEVVYQGGQFSPASSGILSGVLAQGARSDCYQAAQDAVNGANNIGGCLYFNSGAGQGIQIGNQHFY